DGIRDDLVTGVQTCALPILAAFIRDGLPGAGMPGFPLADPDMRTLIAFLRTLRPKEGSAPPRISVKTTDGRTLEGVALNQSSFRSEERRVGKECRCGWSWNE